MRSCIALQAVSTRYLQAYRRFMSANNPPRDTSRRRGPSIRPSPATGIVNPSSDLMLTSALHKRLSAMPPPVSPALLQEKMLNAERKRKERLDKLVMREKAKVKRAT